MVDSDFRNTGHAPSYGEHHTAVYAVIPVFNRLQRTLRCIECLKAQTFQPITIIVSDGRSTDGTPEKLRELHPAVVVLTSETELWWGGATQKGIEWALNHSTSDDDFVLMINNDTHFEPGYVGCLVKEARAHNVAIGGIVVDEADPNILVDGGVRFDWQDYSFRGRQLRPRDPGVSIGPTDVLPGRGTLIPIAAIRRAGNVDGEAFPHYLADYEFTYRLKQRGGIGLAVSLDAVIRTERPLAKPRPTRHPLVESWLVLRQKFSRSSKSNIQAHWRFIDRHAPPDLKNRLRWRMARATVHNALAPLYPVRLARLAKQVVGNSIGLIRRPFAFAYRAIWGPYLVHNSDIERFRLDREELLRRKVILRSGFPDHWAFARFSHVSEQCPEALPLFRRATTFGHKRARLRETRRLKKALEDSAAGPGKGSTVDRNVAT
jgi:GT2 family glycosyltransferase